MLTQNKPSLYSGPDDCTICTNMFSSGGAQHTTIVFSSYLDASASITSTCIISACQCFSQQQAKALFSLVLTLDMGCLFSQHNGAV